MITQYEALATIKQFADDHATTSQWLGTTTGSWLALHGPMESAYWGAKPSDDRQAALNAALDKGRSIINARIPA